jgi:hypothetical protein
VILIWALRKFAYISRLKPTVQQPDEDNNMFDANDACWTSIV